MVCLSHMRAAKALTRPSIGLAKYCTSLPATESVDSLEYTMSKSNHADVQFAVPILARNQASFRALCDNYN